MAGFEVIGDTGTNLLLDENAISPELRQEPLVKDVSEQLTGIEKLVSFPAGQAPSAEDVKKLNEAVGKLMTKIESKESAK